MSGAGTGAKNGAEWARKPNERERDLKKNTAEQERSGSGRSRERERSGERAESAAHHPLKPNN